MKGTRHVKNGRFRHYKPFLIRYPMLYGSLMTICLFHWRQLPTEEQSFGLKDLDLQFQIAACDAMVGNVFCYFANNIFNMLLLTVCLFGRSGIHQCTLASVSAFAWKNQCKWPTFVWTNFGDSIWHILKSPCSGAYHVSHFRNTKIFRGIETWVLFTAGSPTMRDRISVVFLWFIWHYTGSALYPL